MNVQEILTKWGFNVDHKPLEKLEHRLEQIKNRLEFLSAAEVVKGVFELAERFGHFAENLGTAAASAGVTAEELQKLQFAAGQAGVGAEQVSGAMARLSRTLYEARNGSAEAKKSFAAAGFTEQQVAGFATGTDALAALADRMQGMTDPIQKQALAMQLLGRGSANMVEFLSDGSKGINEMKEKAERLGTVISSKDIKSLRDLEDTLSALGQTFRAFSAHMAAQFGPAIRYVVDELQRLYAANKEFIAVNLLEWAGTAAYAFGFIFGVVRTLAGAFFDLAKAHEGLVKGLGVGLLGALGLNEFAKIAETFSPGVKLVALGFKGLWKAGGKLSVMLAKMVGNLALMLAKLPLVGDALLALNTAMLANPVAATIAVIVAALAALALAINAAYVMLFQHGDFKDTWLGQMWSGVKGFGSYMAKMLGISIADPSDYQHGMDLHENEHWEEGKGKGKKATKGRWVKDKPQSTAPEYLRLQAQQDALIKGLSVAGELPNLVPREYAPSPNDPGARMIPASTAGTTIVQTVNITVGKGANTGEIADAVQAASKKGVQEAIPKTDLSPANMAAGSQAVH